MAGSLDFARDDSVVDFLRRALGCFLQAQRQRRLIRAWLRNHQWMLETLDPLHLFGGRMNLSLSIECQSLVATHDRNRDVVARADKERGVDDVVRLMDFP